MNPEDFETIRLIIREELHRSQVSMITTDQLMTLYGIKSKSTINAWQKMGLPYFKGNPNLYNTEDIKQFFKENSIRR